MEIATTIEEVAIRRSLLRCFENLSRSTAPRLGDRGTWIRLSGQVCQSGSYSPRIFAGNAHTPKKISTSSCPAYESRSINQLTVLRVDPCANQGASIHSQKSMADRSEMRLRGGRLCRNGAEKNLQSNCELHRGCAVNQDVRFEKFRYRPIPKLR